jgi:hypothetical protein
MENLRVDDSNNALFYDMIAITYGNVFINKGKKYFLYLLESVVKCGDQRFTMLNHV